MTASVSYCGVVYDATTDWRDLIAHPSYKGLEKDLDIQSTLGALAEALRGTPMAIAFGDAALEVIERGDLRNMDTVRAAGWERAPRAFERILAVIERTPRVLPESWIVQLYAALLSLREGDARVLRALEMDAGQSASPELLELASKAFDRMGLCAALRDVASAAEAIDAFLSAHAPRWAGYGRHIAELAAELQTRPVASADVRALQDRAYEPFGGTFGSMHDLSFFGPREDEYQELKARLGRALDAVEASFRAIHAAG